MTQTIVNGGTRSSQDLYVGAPNEVTADTSNAELRLHDGSTPGGKRIPNLDTNDAKYQARNEEIDGLKFDANAKGFLVRLSTGVYRLRKFLASGGIDVDFPDGYGGDISISLATQIPGDHQFQGDVIIDGVLQVDSGINADTAGTHTGNLIGDSTGTHTGNVDVRGATLSLDDGQIAQSKINGLAASLAQYNLPVGMVILWAGTIATIPNHWHLCDGTSGTPDLRGLFVVGAATEDEMFATIGTETHTHVATVDAAGTHSHAISVADTVLTVGQIPAHNHGNGVNDQTAELMPYGIKASPQTSRDVEAANHGSVSTQGITETNGGGQGHGHGASSSDAGSHTHTISLQPGSNIPPSTLLAYIMKIS